MSYAKEKYRGTSVYTGDNYLEPCYRNHFDPQLLQDRFYYNPEDGEDPDGISVNKDYDSYDELE